jgi:hypothetical protein
VSTTILAQRLLVGDKIDRHHSAPAKVVSVAPIGGRIVVKITQLLSYYPNEPVTVYRDATKGGTRP